jgi:uncharacterized protein DUF2017
MLEQPFMPRGNGWLDVRLSSNEADAIRRVATDILDELKDTTDPDLRRLFPPAYKDDPQREEEFEVMTRDDLLIRKKNAAEAVVKSIDKGKSKKGTWSGRLDEELAQAWLALINDARLILGTRLDVTEDMEPEPLPSEHADAQQYNLYLYLGALESALVDALMFGLPPGTND